MKPRNTDFGRIFLFLSIVMLLCGVLLGVIASGAYIIPGFMKDKLGFIALRPMHVSSAMFWIILGATGSVYSGMRIITGKGIGGWSALAQLLLWLVAIAGIFYSYFTQQFGGREYWEFDPIWALPIAGAWLLFLVNFLRAALSVKGWPVYIWMWMTGIVFFLFCFVENYLWIIPAFREHFVTDMTIQWKVNGSLVGAWNQMLYGTAFFLMDRIQNKSDTGHSKLAFGMYFLGLFNLMFNWGHHIYTLPTDMYIRYVSYAVSMTEWIIFARIIYTWRQSVSDIQKHYHYFPYRFLMAADIWVFINIGQALLMSIPAINIYTHGTHITVAHAMGTTIGINSMIILAAGFEFFSGRCDTFRESNRVLSSAFWITQVSLFIFFMALNVAGIKKGIWQMSAEQVPFAAMMQSLRPWFIVFAASGALLMLSLSTLGLILVRSYLRCSFRSFKKGTLFNDVSFSSLQYTENGK